jgi:leucine dehydrogenase
MRPLNAPVSTARSAAPPSAYEDLRVLSGPRSDATIAIAVHSTALGPALGGVRVWHYDSAGDGVTDALRLARAMTYKAAAAGLDLGGGKGVICAPTPQRPVGKLRRRMLLDFGDAVESLEGRYVTAEDVGTGAADMVAIAERTAHVVGLPRERGGRGDPSPLTARGVLAAMGACLEHRFGNASAAGVRVCVVGVGNVGSRLARKLADAGAELAISDIDPRARMLAEELGAAWIDPEEAIAAECDVLALRRAASRRPGGSRNPLRTRLHRQRRRPDQRLRGAARSGSRGGPRPSRPDRLYGTPNPRGGRPEGGHAPRRSPGAGAAAPAGS